MRSTLRRARSLKTAALATAIVATLTLTPAAVAFADDIDGGPGPSVVGGTDADDTLNGDVDASDSILAVVDGDDDVVNGHAGSDDIRGDGNSAAYNTAVVNGGDDVIDGGEGNDSIFGDGTASAVEDGSLYGGDDVIHGGAGEDYIVGDGAAGGRDSSYVEGGDDILYGDSDDDVIFGDGLVRAGGVIVGDNDQLYGGIGKDFLDGDGGNDLLCGLGGGEVNTENDTLYGDEGSDLACAVDDHVVVSAGEKTLIQLAANDEQLDDEGTEDGVLQYALGTITGDILHAVIDALTGELTVTAGCDGGTVGYTVTRDDVDASVLSTSAVATIDVRNPCLSSRSGGTSPADTVDETAVLPDTGAGAGLSAVGAGGLGLVLAGAFLVVVASRERRQAT